MIDESCASVRYNPVNFVNLHYRRYVNDILDSFLSSDFIRRVHQSRPSVILALDNEYLT